MAEFRRKDKTLRAAGSRRLAGFLLLAAAVLGPARAADAQIAPDGDWATLRTTHFDVTFPSGLEAVGRRAARLAEEAWVRLGATLHPPPRDRVELLLTDDVDQANGYAFVRPPVRVVVYLRPPVDGYALSNYDDWLDLVITHELAHVVHLDVTSAVGAFLRAIFGRPSAGWPLFPELAVPGWTIEGLATWYESRLGDQGRGRGTYFEMMLRTAALGGGLETIDRASGSSPQWPAGERDYLYGVSILQALVSRHGEAGMRAYLEATAGQWIPYRPDAAARDAFGEGFSPAWEAWSTEVRLRADSVRDLLSAAPGGLTVPERLTRGGRLVGPPAVAADGAVVYPRSDGRSDAQLRRRDPASGEDAFLLRTNGNARVAVGPDGTVLLAQAEYRDNYRVLDDLWRVEPTGEARRITRGARLDQPALSPDGAWAAAVRTGSGTTELVRVDVASGASRPLPELPAGPWAMPSISPDGRWIAATRWAAAGRADVVIVDATSGEVALEVTRDRAIDLAPTWTRAGTALLWGSDRTGVPQIVTATVDPGSGQVGPVEAVTRVVTGVAFPALDEARGWLYVTEYTADGWELARVSWFPDGPRSPAPLDARFRASAAPPRPELPPETEAALAAPVRPYSSLPSLRPRYWAPLVAGGVDRRGRAVVEDYLGFSTGGEDVVGRHAWGLRAAMSLGGQLAGSAGYAWRGLGVPVLSLDVQQDWDADGPFTVQPEGGEPRVLYVRERERRMRLGLTLDRVRFRSLARLAASGGMVWESRDLLDADLGPEETYSLARPTARLAEGQLALTLSTARGHALSLGREEGASLFLLGRIRRERTVADSLRGVRGQDRSRNDLLGQLTLYQSFPGPGFADAVVALRLAGGRSRGPGADAFSWDLGGARGQVEGLTGFSLFGGTSLFFPLRGYEEGVRSGWNAWAASAELRVPLVMVNRGLGLVPLHLDRLQATAFLDAGNAWGPAGGGPGYDSVRRDPLASTGVELTTTLTLLYRLPVVFRTGLAFPLVESSSPGLYLRLGLSF